MRPPVVGGVLLIVQRRADGVEGFVGPTNAARCVGGEFEAQLYLIMLRSLSRPIALCAAASLASHAHARSQEQQPARRRPILFFGDLDGTLLGKDTALLAFRDYWRRVEAPAGSVLCYNTGRCIAQYLQGVQHGETGMHTGRPLRGELPTPDVLITGDGTEVRWRVDGTDAAAAPRYDLDREWDSRIRKSWWESGLRDEVRRRMDAHALTLTLTLALALTPNRNSNPNPNPIPNPNPNPNPNPKQVRRRMDAHDEGLIPNINAASNNLHGGEARHAITFSDAARAEQVCRALQSELGEACHVYTLGGALLGPNPNPNPNPNPQPYPNLNPNQAGVTRRRRWWSPSRPSRARRMPQRTCCVRSASRARSASRRETRTTTRPCCAAASPLFWSPTRAVTSCARPRRRRSRTTTAHARATRTGASRASSTFAPRGSYVLHSKKLSCPVKFTPL